MTIEIDYLEGINDHLDEPPARHDRTLAMHSCRFEHRPDDLAAPGIEQYLIRCRCHSSSWAIWRPGDPEFVCPSVTGGPDRSDAFPGLPRAGQPL